MFLGWPLSAVLGRRHVEEGSREVPIKGWAPGNAWRTSNLAWASQDRELLYGPCCTSCWRRGGGCGQVGGAANSRNHGKLKGVERGGLQVQLHSRLSGADREEGSNGVNKETVLLVCNLDIFDSRLWTTDSAGRVQEHTASMYGVCTIQGAALQSASQ